MSRLIASLLLIAAVPVVHSAPPGAVAAIGAGVGHAGQQLLHSPGISGKQGQALDNRAPSLNSAQAAQQAQQRYGGKVLDVHLVRKRNGAYYRVKLLHNGSVRIVHIDAN